MSNAQTPASGKPAYEAPDGDSWSSSLMGRTEELGHVQAQVGPVPAAVRSTPGAEEYSEAGARDASMSGAGGAPVPGTPMPRAPAAARGPAGAPRTSPVPSAPPPAPPRPLAAVLRLGSAGFGLLAAVLLVLPELQHVREGAPAGALVPAEQTLAPSFDEGAPASEGQVREERAAIPGTSLLIAESEPAGATVSVDGVKQGATPLSLTLECTPGAPLRVSFTRKGFESVEHATVCRADTMTRLSTRLRKSRGGARP